MFTDALNLIIAKRKHERKLENKRKDYILKKDYCKTIDHCKRRRDYRN